MWIMKGCKADATTHEIRTHDPHVPRATLFPWTDLIPSKKLSLEDNHSMSDNDVSVYFRYLIRRDGFWDKLMFHKIQAVLAENFLAR